MKTGSIEGELRLNGAAATQNCLENTKAFLWEYRTSVKEGLAVEWFFRDYLRQSEGLASLRDF